MEFRHDFVLQFLDPEGHPDLKGLAASTKAALDIVRPWCERHGELKSPALKDIINQSKLYKDAIEISIFGAKYSQAMAQEAIDFANQLLNTNLLSKKQAYEQWLRGIMRIAAEGLSEIDKVIKVFENVTVRVQTLIGQAQEEASSKEAADLDKLRQGIPDLEKFRACIALYHQWWLRIGSTQHVASSQTRNTMSLEFHEPNRLQNIKKRWEDLRESYKDYVGQIGVLVTSLSDFDPELTPTLHLSRQLDESTLEHLANIYTSENDQKTKVGRAKDLIGVISNGLTAPKIEGFLNAIKTSKDQLTEGYENARKIVMAFKQGIAKKKPIDANIVHLIGKELTHSKDIRERFTSVRRVIIISDRGEGQHVHPIPATHFMGSDSKAGDPKLTTTLDKLGQAALAESVRWNSIVTDQEVLQDKLGNMDQYSSLIKSWKGLHDVYHKAVHELTSLQFSYPIEFAEFQ